MSEIWLSYVLDLLAQCRNKLTVKILSHQPFVIFVVMLCILEPMIAVVNVCIEKFLLLFVSFLGEKLKDHRDLVPI